jgi:hypothetical protein
MKDQKGELVKEEQSITIAPTDVRRKSLLLEEKHLNEDELITESNLKTEMSSTALKKLYDSKDAHPMISLRETING